MFSSLSANAVADKPKLIPIQRKGSGSHKGEA
ncbi:hypothetical protein MASRES_GEN12937_19325 [Acinetobacter baumannii]